VALDLDETLGAFGLASLAYQICMRYRLSLPTMQQVFIDSYLALGGARPGLTDLLSTLRLWRQQGRIDRIVVFTAASNLNGWVDFLCGCIERFVLGPDAPGEAERPLFDGMFVREDSPTVCGRTWKDLSRVSCDKDSVVLIDDKPAYALNGYVVGVPEYTQAVPHHRLMGWIIGQLPAKEKSIRSAFSKDAEKHPPSPDDQSGDQALNGCLEVLAELFPEGAPC
jgi:hypothetical protein